MFVGGSAAVTQAITGLGGIGKTQIAVEYSYRNKERYSIIWWIRAEEPETLTADYAALARELNLPIKNDADQKTIVDAVCHYLEKTPNWLLIFDNADKPADLRRFIPRGSTGHILITSRNPNWAGMAHTLTIEKMDRQESIKFLKKRTNQGNEAAANKLAEELGDLPLALEQAGAYIEATGITFLGYLELFKVNHIRLLECRKPETDYPYTVSTTWELSFKQAQIECPHSADLLNICSFFAPSLGKTFAKTSAAIKNHLSPSSLDNLSLVTACTSR